MHFLYCVAEGNGRRTQRMYSKCFPQRICKHYPTFSAIHDRLGNTGTLMVSKRNAGRPQTVHTPNFDEEVLLHIENNQATSTRAIANELGVHHDLEWNVLHEQVLHAFCPCTVLTWDQMTIHQVLSLYAGFCNILMKTFSFLMLCSLQMGLNLLGKVW